MTMRSLLLCCLVIIKLNIMFSTGNSIVTNNSSLPQQLQNISDVNMSSQFPLYHYTLEAPQYVNNGTFRYVLRGDTIHLPCCNVSLPNESELDYLVSAEMVWVGPGGVPINVTSGRCAVQDDGSLIISNVQYQDAGTYTCRKSTWLVGSEAEKNFTYSVTVFAYRVFYMDVSWLYQMPLPCSQEDSEEAGRMLEALDGLLCQGSRQCTMRELRANCVFHSQSHNSSDRLVVGFELEASSPQRNHNTYSDSNCGGGCSNEVERNSTAMLEEAGNYLLDILRRAPELVSLTGRNSTQPATLLLESFHGSLHLGCPAGFGLWRLMCIPCGQGFYSPDLDPTCYQCDYGFYQTGVTGSGCVRCPDNFTTAAMGASTLQECQNAWMVGLTQLIPVDILFICSGALVLIVVFVVLLIIRCCVRRCVSPLHKEDATAGTKTLRLACCLPWQDVEMAESDDSDIDEKYVKEDRKLKVSDIKRLYPDSFSYGEIPSAASSDEDD